MPDDNGASWLGRAQLILVLGLMAVAIYFARAPTGIAVDGNEVTGRTAPAPEVSVVLPTPARRGMTVSMTGTITVDAQVGVVPLAAGQVVSVSEALRAGGTFAAGQVLLTIDDERYRLVVERAQAEVDRARARLRDRELEAEEERERYRREHPGGKLPARLVEQPKVAKARAQLAAAVIDEKASRITLSDTQLSLPFDGKTISSGVEVGQVVAAVTPVARVYARDALRSHGADSAGRSQVPAASGWPCRHRVCRRSDVSGGSSTRGIFGGPAKSFRRALPAVRGRRTVWSPFQCRLLLP